MVGSEREPLRVAIVGSGPAGFYAVSNLGRYRDLHVEIDMFDRLPTPFGLVRAGVAPDHQKDKSVTRKYDKSARQSNFRFYGNVEYGKHIDLGDLERHYHQIVVCTGAQSDKTLDIPGEELAGSHPATDFVAWYNGHPDYAHLRFELDAESAAVIGVGNVAVDVARILCRTPEELQTTDIADYALEALAASRVREVYMLGRRGPAQAAFTAPEVQALGELPGADVRVAPAEAELDAASRAVLEAAHDKDVTRKVGIVQEFAAREAEGKPRRLTIRFLVSPKEILGDEHGRVRAIRVVRNELYAGEDGGIRTRPTGEEEEIPVGLVFRSVGYRGVPLPGLPFREDKGLVPNDAGRVIDADGARVPGLYVAGWIKRGPTGVIGTNKTDSQETVACMMADLEAGATLTPEAPDVDAVRELVRARQPDAVTYDDWSVIDAAETAAGEAQNRPRVKFTSVEQMLALLRS